VARCAVKEKKDEGKGKRDDEWRRWRERGGQSFSRRRGGKPENPKTETKNQPPPQNSFVSQQESSRAQCLDTALDKEERVRILTRKC
jgi:hypothetical protein